VPQGSVLGPILFLIFINDLDSSLVSSVFKFADDTKLVGKANSTQDSIHVLLQRDLQQLIDWSDRWLIPFNKSKCKVMHLGHGNREYQYFMIDQLLQSVKEEKDLGVQISHDMKPSRFHPMSAGIYKSKQGSRYD